MNRLQAYLDLVIHYMPYGYHDTTGANFSYHTFL